jgi:signal transduction histidine kinase
MNTDSARAAAQKLPDFIEKNREAILQEWDSFAQSLDFERTMSPETQRDHAEQMLDAIAEDMRTTESLVEKELKGKGLSPDNSPALKTAGHEHAIARLAEQFSLSELVSEFRAIRASVLRLWARQNPNAAEHLNDIVRFNESLDEILAASSQSYSTKINEARNVIIGILAHDLRNPINSVMLGARHLLQSKSTESNDIKSVARIQRAASRMSELVSNLLDYARTSLGDSIPVFPAPVTMSPICSRAVEEVEAAYPGRHISLVCPQDVEGSWDSSRLIQLLTNLLVNAIQHGAASGVVSVTVSPRVDSVVLEVHNEGEPISAGSLGALFHPLYRRASVDDGTHKAESSGLGLGLFIASEIARSHGGDIKVVSTREGGTLFSVELPKSSPPLRAATPEE